MSVADRGGSAIIVEKQGSLGGNSAKASSGINSVWNRTDDVIEFLEDTLRSQSGHGDRALAKILTESANVSVAWLEGVTGVNLTSVGQMGGHSTARTWKPEHGVVGAELMAGLIHAVKIRAPQITVITRASVKRILTDDKGAAVGVEYVEGSGEKIQMHGRSIVLASGGFGFDTEGLLRSYRPDLVGFPTTLGSHTTGDGIRLAAAVGADLVDMEFVQLHPTGFIDPTDPGNRVKVLAAEVLRGMGGILVDPNGRRFVGELDTRKVVANAMIKYTDKVFSLILPGSAARDKLVQVYLSRGLLVKVSSLAALSRTVGSEQVEKTIREYSDFSKRDQFGRTKRVPLDEGSWLVAKVTPVVHYTMGGVRVDSTGRVLKRSGEAVANLFAVGEVSGGVHGENRLGGNSLLECTVYGRIIGGSSVPVHRQLTPSHFRQVLKTPTPAPRASRKISLSEVGSHNTSPDCWTVIDGKVYDLSRYAEDHPGGAPAIRHSCGKDSTARFLVAHSLGLLEDMEFNPIGTL